MLLLSSPLTGLNDGHCGDDDDKDTKMNVSFLPSIRRGKGVSYILLHCFKLRAKLLQSRSVLVS